MGELSQRGLSTVKTPLGFLAQDIGEKEGSFIMKKKASNWNMPQGKLIRVKDFLPPPDQLVMPEVTVKVTIALNRSTVDFFKKQAGKNKVKYQRMIREVLDRYTVQYRQAA